MKGRSQEGHERGKQGKKKRERDRKGNVTRKEMKSNGKKETDLSGEVLIRG